MRSPSRVLLPLVLLLFASLASPCAPAPSRAPDLTQNLAGVDRKLTYNLGPTGLRGWIYTHPATYLDSLQGRTTAAARQILVTHVGAHSPASGLIEVNDVILGVNGQPFTDDARKSFGRAIAEAEQEANGGILKLLRFRQGKTETVELKLKVMGSYSATAPYDCPKSKQILDDACKALAKEQVNDSWNGAVVGLAMLASGKPEFLPKVQAGARAMAPKKPLQGCDTWSWGYKNVFLSEYYLLSGDAEVLPAIRQYTVALARGQSRYGTFGHGGAELTPEGKLHGSIPPYGPVNAAGLIANLAIVLGQKCGVSDPEVDLAIDRADRFFSYYVDKGAIPYGEHEPWPYHENNGKNSMAAVLFALQPGQTVPARFFAQMATAGYANREYGHTGQGFSYLWSALGANVGGPEAVTAFFHEAAWHFDLVRRCDGSFTYDGGEQYGAGKTDDDTYYGNSSYDGLSPNATYVLTYSIPLKKLYITGKEANPANWLTKQEAAAAIKSGRFDLERLHQSTDQLVAAFSDWSPIVRGWAAEELAHRPQAKAMVPRLIQLAQSQDAHVRQGATETLGYLRSPAALPVLVALLDHPDRWTRYKAAQALKKYGDAARPALAGMLQAVATTAEPADPVAWADPVQIAQGQLAEAIFHGLLRRSLEGADKQLVYPAIRVISRNPDGAARAQLRDTFQKQLSLEDVQALGPDILAALKTLCPADTMFGNEIRMGAFKALTKYHFKEGIEAGVEFARTQGGHGSETRTGEIMKELVSYGAAARGVIPQLNELIVSFNDQCKRGKFPAGQLNNQRVNAVKEAINAIESATTQPTLRSVLISQNN